MRLIQAAEAQLRERDRVTYQAWGGRLTPAEWALREERLRAHAWSRAGLAGWLLMDQDEKVLASCETYRMQSYLQGAPGTTLGVASVFCEPALRGRGYASRLMALLGAHMQRERAQAGILFSDVGAPLYERAGYVARPAGDLVFAPAGGDPAAAVDGLLDEANMAAALASVPIPGSRFLVWPSAEQLDWHLERSRTYATLFRRPRAPSCGARAGQATAFWAADLWKNRLQVLLIVAADASATSALIEAARREAARSGLDGVRLWLDPEAPDPGRAGLGAGRPAPREGSLPMIRAFAAGLAPEDWTLIPRGLWI